MFGRHEYIKEKFKDYRYSKNFYAQSKVSTVTGNAEIKLPLNDQGACVVIINSIQWDTLAVQVNNTFSVTFTDSTGQVLLYQFNTGGYNMPRYIGYLQETSILNVISNSAIISFIVEYQFLVKPKGQ